MVLQVSSGNEEIRFVDEISDFLYLLLFLSNLILSLVENKLKNKGLHHPRNAKT